VTRTADLSARPGLWARSDDQPRSLAARWSHMPGWAVPFAVAAALRLIFILFNETDPGDWVTRTVRAHDVVERGAGIWARTPWPEGNYLLPALPMLLGGDPYWSVRVFAAAVASLAVPLVYLLARRIGGPRAAPVAAWILALLPFHIYISANGAMTEGPFLVFVLGASLTGSLWFERPWERRWLIYAGLCVVGAELFRFDGVLVGAAIGLLALFARDGASSVVRRPRHIRTIALYAAIALAYPVALLLSWRLMYGDAFYMVTFAADATRQFFVSGAHLRWPRWLYAVYSGAFWTFLAPAFALTPVIWLTSVWGAWAARRRPQTWFVLLPVGVLVLFYLHAALTHTVLNQVRYITAVSLPLLVFVGVPFGLLSRGQRRLLASACVVGALATQSISLYAAWRERGVISRQLGPYALVRPNQHTAQRVAKWLDRHGANGQRVIVTPHAESAWLTLAVGTDRPNIVLLHVHRTPNQVYDSSGMANAIRDSLATAQWLVTSGRRNTHGLQDGLVSELVQPTPSTQSGSLQWNGIHMHLRADFGAMKVFEVVPNPRRTSTPTTPGRAPTR
jgi:4-amino-4-deoxy-L-arabinose transferase-like glycosyltransferase